MIVISLCDVGSIVMWYGNLGGQIEGYQSGLKILQNAVMSRTFCLWLPLLCRPTA